MNNSFLEELVDTTSNNYVFGKNEMPRQSIFLWDKELQNPGTESLNINLYKGNELQPVNNGPIHKSNFPPDWVFPVLLLIFAFFAWLRFFYNRYFSQLLKAFLNINLSNQIVRDENIFFQRISIYLSITFNVIAALFIYLISVYYKWSFWEFDSGFKTYFFLVIVVTLVYSLKFLILKTCGWLFEMEKETSLYIFNIFLINNILGIALLPFICLLAFIGNPEFSFLFILPLIFIFSSFGWRIFRGIQIGFGTASFSPLYLFLYLCTLEIAPLMVLIRIFVQ